MYNDKNSLKIRTKKNVDKYAFFLDIDNTLWKHGVIPEINKETIKQVRAMGHKVFVNTGRSYAFIPQRLFEEIELDGVISGIGGTIRIDGEIVEKTYLSREDLIYIYELCKDKGTGIFFEGEYKTIFYDRKDENNPRFFCDEEGERVFFDADVWKKKYINEPISKATVHGFIPTEEQAKELSSRFVLIPQMVDNYTEMGILGYDKAKGMLRVAQILGIDRSHCVAMGDSPNDIPMLEAAGISVAMGDAYDEVKDICDIVSVNCSDGGVAHAMKQILKI